MNTLYLICAIVGGTLWVCQFVLSMLGGGHHDVGGGDAGGDMHGGDHGGGHEDGGVWLASLLTFRTITAALTFFGLGGLSARQAGYQRYPALGIACLAGLIALAVVAIIMRLLRRLEAEGTVHIEGAVGSVATVYLTVPANKAGVGKVTLKLQNRTMEYRALSGGSELPTGSQVVVVAVVSPDTVEVIPART